MVGYVWACAEQDTVPAGEAALGYICATFHATGIQFPLIQDIRTYVYARGKGAGPAEEVGTVYWVWGMRRALLMTEGIRTAMRQSGNQPLTGAQVQ